MEKILSVLALIVIFLVLIVCVRDQAKRLNPKYNLVDDFFLLVVCGVAAFIVLFMVSEPIQNMVLNRPDICGTISILSLIIFGGLFLYRNKEALKKTWKWEIY